MTEPMFWLLSVVCLIPAALMALAWVLKHQQAQLTARLMTRAAESVDNNRWMKLEGTVANNDIEVRKLVKTLDEKVIQLGNRIR